MAAYRAKLADKLGVQRGLSATKTDASSGSLKVDVVDLDHIV